MEHLKDLPLKNDSRVLVLGPHPDDFDAIAVSMRLLHKGGAHIAVAVMTSGASGVEDCFVPEACDLAKARIREEEQRESVRFFGLPDDRLFFLRLAEGSDGHMREDEENLNALRQVVHGNRPDAICMPHGNDTNLDHQRAFRMVEMIAAETTPPVRLLLNRDPKTVSMRHDLVMPFDERDAVWKAELLRFHKSQHQRNLNMRGHGFDARILDFNRRIAAEVGAGAPYAELFELFHATRHQ